MKPRVERLFAAREGRDRDASYKALVELMTLTERPVDWAYEVWDRTVEQLAHREGSVRAFAAQLLARLAISDPEERLLDDFPVLEAVLRDPKTVTARHTLQSIWRVGLAGPEQRALVLDALERRFEECASEKHGSLVRTDAITALGELARATGDPAAEELAVRLVESEADEQARRKQRAAWRKATK